jgi:two-component system chemotaxis response regulator CheY
MKPLNALIIDDSSVMRKIVTRSLAQAGYTFQKVSEAGNGQEALDTLEASQPDLIMCDINMPVMDGLTFLQRLREQPSFQRVPVIMVTTEHNEHCVLEAVSSGANGFIQKPFAADEIKEKLNLIFG